MTGWDTTDGADPVTPALGNGLAGILSGPTDQAAPTPGPEGSAVEMEPAAPDQSAQATPAEPVLDHPLSAAYEDGRRPWAWGNLDQGEISVQEAILDVWVIAYNDELVGDQTGLIPACWRQHLPLVHELPVLYWAWWFSHVDEQTEISVAADFYGKTLPGFRSRLGELLGPGAANCRKGRHSDGFTGEFVDCRDAIADRLSGSVDDDAQFTGRALTAFPSTRVKKTHAPKA